MRNRWLAAGIAVLVLFAAACGSDDSSGPVDGSGTTTTAVAARADAMNLALVDCPRFGSGSGVGATRANTYLRGDLEPLALGGQAPFALQVLECADLVTDGESHGPGRFATAWIKVAEIAALPDLPATSELEARASDAFQVVLFQTDNAGFQEATAAFGIPMTLADSMTFDPPEPGIQTGAVTDNQFEPALAYGWTVDNVNESDHDPTVAFHTLLGSDDRGERLTYFGEFTHRFPPGARWAGNLGTVTLEPGSAFSDLVGEEFSGPVNGDAVSVRMTVFREVD